MDREVYNNSRGGGKILKTQFCLELSSAVGAVVKSLTAEAVLAGVIR